MSKSVKKIASFALPMLATPLLGPAGLGLTGTSLMAGTAGLGALGGALGGGGLKGALLGGLGSAISNGGLFGNTLGKTGGSVLGGAISGLGSGGGLSSALLGAAGGLGNSLLSGSSQYSGGKVGSVPPVKPDAVTGLSGSGLGGLSSYAKPLIGAIGAYNDMETADELEKLVREQQSRNQQALRPYSQAGYAANKQLQDRLTQGFTAPDLQNDPGYQFQLSEAQKALDRSSSARGNYFSGAALKAAGDRAQGLADATYNDAYQRWLSQNAQLAGQSGQGLNALGGTIDAGNLSMMGSGSALGQKSNAFNQYLAKITGEDEQSALLRALGIA